MALIIGVEGTALSAADRVRLAHPAVFGAILFARNYENTAQLGALCAAIKAIRPMPIFVDQEGGRIQRFCDGFTALPSAKELGERYAENAEDGVKAAYDCGRTMMAELIACGVDVSFAPVLDMANPESKVLAERTFSADPDAIVALAFALISGMRAGGGVAIGKHFPGHGGVTGDTHIAAPSDTRAFADLWTHDLWPYRRLTLDGVMVAHLCYPAVDGEDAVPASMSAKWITGILRQTLRFQGLVLSDDLTMRAVTHVAPVARVEQCLRAGCDVVIWGEVAEPAHALELDAILHTLRLDDNAKGGDARARLLETLRANRAHQGI